MTAADTDVSHILAADGYLFVTKTRQQCPVE